MLSYIHTSVGIDVAPAFIDNNIDGSLLPYLTTEHLKELDIQPLASRLKVKKAINDLLVSKPGLNGLNPAEEQSPAWTAASTLNKPQVTLEALSLLLSLCRTLLATSLSSGASDDIKKLNDSFAKLKLDLFPLVRYLKDTKPLPTPTLDPGLLNPSPQSLLPSMTTFFSPTENGPSSLGNASVNRASSAGSSHLPNHNSATTPSASALTPGESPANTPTSTAPSLLSINHHLVSHLHSNNSLQSSLQRHPSSPSLSKRFSVGSVFSTGVGKPTDLSNMRLHSLQRLPAKLVDSRINVNDRNLPREVDEKILKEKVASPTNQSSTTQPLKQLKASSEDTCLKVLHQAMKRHHIPRHHWSKYVLVICYGDKERILKLTEKPVPIFKELQELNKNPAIMLRELAAFHTNEHEKYEDSRIGDEIPGGTL